MTVSDLISFLQTLPKELLVVYQIYSDQRLLETKDIEIEELGFPREDGWVQNKRPDKPSQKYLVFPGN